LVKQRLGKDFVQFINRFEDVSLDCYGDHKEKGAHGDLHI